MTPIATPFLFNGVSARAMEGLAPALARAGLVPAQGGTTSRSSTTTPGAESKIVPGAGVGIKLVRGDVEFAAICRSEEHTSELQSRLHLVCRLLLEKKNKTES